MISLFNKVKSIGFDLDNTLYPNNPEIDNRIRNKIAEYIFLQKPELGNIENARGFYNERYSEVASGVKILEEIGLKDAKRIMFNCLNRDVLDLISEDYKLVSIIKKINQNYNIFLITAGPKNSSIGKLKKIGINISIFSKCLFGEDLSSSKSDGHPFADFLKDSKFLPNEHIYVGDSRLSDIIPAKKAGMKTIAVGNIILEADISIDKIYDIERLLL